MTICPGRKATLGFLIDLIIMLIILGVTAMIITNILGWSVGQPELKSFARLSASLSEFSKLSEGSSSMAVLEMGKKDVVVGFSRYAHGLYRDIPGLFGTESFLRRPEVCPLEEACICHCSDYSAPNAHERACLKWDACTSLPAIDVISSVSQIKLVPSAEYLVGDQHSNLQNVRNGFIIDNTGDDIGLVQEIKPIGKLNQLLIEKGKRDIVGVCVYDEGRQCLDQAAQEQHLQRLPVRQALQEIEGAVKANNDEEAAAAAGTIAGDSQQLALLDPFEKERLSYFYGAALQRLGRFQEAHAVFETAEKEGKQATGTYLSDIEKRLRLTDCTEQKACEDIDDDICEEKPCGLSCIVNVEILESRDFQNVQRTCITPIIEAEARPEPAAAPSTG